MKIIARDNFNRDYIPDWLVAENVNEHMGSKIVNLLNESEGGNSPNYYDLVDDDYELLTLQDIY